MKQIIIFLIEVYQKTLSIFLQHIFGTKNMCRFSPTCSEYAKQAIKTHGVLKGGLRAIARIISCQPFVSTQVSKSRA